MLFSSPLALPEVIYFFAHIILLFSIFSRSILGLIFAAVLFVVAHILYYVAFRNLEMKTGNGHFGTAALFMVIAASLILLIRHWCDSRHHRMGVRGSGLRDATRRIVRLNSKQPF